MPFGMKPILIHVHVFYEEMWPALACRLKNLMIKPHSLWVSLPVNGKLTESHIREEFPDAEVVSVENRGYDIAPFVEVLRRVTLSDYSYCVKLHTKRDIVGLHYPHVGRTEVGGSKWREYLLSFIEPENWERCLLRLESDPGLGMVGSHALICRNGEDDNRAWTESLSWLREFGFEVESPAFVAGSMFVCRAELLKLVLTVLENREFEIPSREAPSTVSHTAERVLGHAMGAQGYRVEDVYTPEKVRRRVHFRNSTLRILWAVYRFFYQRKVSRSGKLIVKVCKIPVFWSAGK